MNNGFFNLNIKKAHYKIKFCLASSFILSIFLITSPASAIQCSQLLETVYNEVRTPETLVFGANLNALNKLLSFDIVESSFQRTSSGASGARVGTLLNPETNETLSVVRKVDSSENRQSSTSEVLVFNLSKIIGLEKLLPIVQRRVNGGLESFQVFHRGGVTLENYSYQNYGTSSFFKEAHIELNKHMVFDFIIGDSIDGAKLEHKIIEHDVAVISIDKGDAFGTHTHFMRGLDRRISQFFESPEGLLFREMLIQRFDRIVSEIERVLGADSRQAKAALERLDKILNLPKPSDFARERTQTEIDFEYIFDGLIDRFTDIPGELSNSRSYEGLIEKISMFRLESTNMLQITELLIELDQQRNQGAELNTSAVQFMIEQIQTIYGDESNELSAFRASLVRS